MKEVIVSLVLLFVRGRKEEGAIGVKSWLRASKKEGIGGGRGRGSKLVFLVSYREEVKKREYKYGEVKK